MRQRAFLSLGFEIHGKQTRRQRFLDDMGSIVPWRKLCRLIEPHSPGVIVAARQLASIGCRGFIFCRSGSTCLTPAWKMRCMTARRCAAS